MCGGGARERGRVSVGVSVLGGVCVFVREKDCA